jgi:hypothetical protein
LAEEKIEAEVNKAEQDEFSLDRRQISKVVFQTSDASPEVERNAVCGEDTTISPTAKSYTPSENANE